MTLHKAEPLYLAVCCTVLLAACDSRPTLRGLHVATGGVTYLFASYSEDLPRAFADSFKQAGNSDSWYRIDFPTSQIQSAKEHSIDLTSNASIGILVSEEDGVHRIGPMGSGDVVQVLSGSLSLEQWKTYNPSMGPIDVYYRLELSGEYRAPSSGGGTTSHVRRSLDTGAVNIFVEQIGP